MRACVCLGVEWSVCEMGWSRMILYGPMLGMCVGCVGWLALCVSNHCVLYSALNSILIFIINSLLRTFHTTIY